MNVCFLLILLTNTSHGKALIVPISGDQFITVNDLKDLKIGFLIFVITSLFHLIRFVWGFFSGRDKDMGDRLKIVEKSQDQVLLKLDNLTLLIAQVKDGQISESEVRGLIRDEQQYVEKLKRRN